jgi:hypothetical protein
VTWSRVLLCLGVIAGVSRAVPSAAVPDVTLWVMQPPGEVVALDLADFSRVGGVRIPPVAFNDPSRIAINGLGQMLVQLDGDHLWLWDGETARTLPTRGEHRGADSSSTAPSTPRQWLLGDDGKSLYVLQSEAARAGASTADSISSSVFVVRATSFAQRPRATIHSSPRRPCERPLQLIAETEPCPDPDIWAPGGVVRGYFILTRWQQEPQIEPEPETLPTASFHRTLYRRAEKKWRAFDFETWSDMPLLDASAHGSSWVQATEDGGCCGWSNDSSDQMVLGSLDTTLTLFDEWSTFHNQDYDVSFFAAKARVAPGGDRVAYTVHATGAPGAEIRVSAEGHADTMELASIQRSLAELPLVEVRGTRPQTPLLFRLSHAELIGWASDSEVLVVERGRIVGVNVMTKERRESRILVRSAEDASVVFR